MCAHYIKEERNEKLQAVREQNSLPLALLEVTDSDTAAASTGEGKRTAPHTLGEMLPPPSENSNHDQVYSSVITLFFLLGTKLYISLTTYQPTLPT